MDMIQWGCDMERRQLISNGRVRRECQVDGKEFQWVHIE